MDGAAHYTVKSGDTLASIAAAHYGSSYDFPLIMLANDIIDDHNLIEPGMELILPAREVNRADGKAKKSLKEYFNELADIEEQDPRNLNDAKTIQGLRDEANQL